MSGAAEGREPNADAAPDRGSWREDDSSLFIDYGLVFTPDRERQHEIIGDLIASVSPTQVVELCCGAGDLAHTLLERLPGAHLLALDGSQTMLEQTRATCQAQGDRLQLASFDLALSDWRSLQPIPDAICSSLAVHHLDGPQKQQLFADLHAALRPGGVFVLADLIKPASPAGWQIAAEDWDRTVAQRSQQFHGDDRGRRKFDALRWNYFSWPDDDGIDQPSTVAEHMAWLEGAGFADVELHWLLAGHAIFSGCKPQA